MRSFSPVASGPDYRGSEPLRNSEHISLFHSRGSLLPLKTIDDDEHFVGAPGRIAAHVVVVHLYGEGSVSHQATQVLGYIHRSIV